MQTFRKLWTFCTSGKYAPIYSLRFLLEKLKQMGKQVINIRTNLGDELAKSSEMYNLLANEYQCGLEITRGYLSWIN